MHVYTNYQLIGGYYLVEVPSRKRVSVYNGKVDVLGIHYTQQYNNN